MEQKISNIEIPVYFTFTELTKTDTGIANQPQSFVQILNLLSLATFLDDIRERYGKPIYVNSAYRTKDVNAVVDGAPRSLHLQGRAADIRPCADPFTSFEENLKNLYSVLEEERDNVTELILYPNFIHVAL